MTEPKFNTREEWLNAFTDCCRPIFRDHDLPLPDEVRVSVGWPSAGARSKAIGECWTFEASEDGHFEIFISPALQGDTARVADVLTHELIHVAVGIDAKHGAPFRKAMKQLGLIGKATATVAGPEWHEWAGPILEHLGPMPGAKLGKMTSSAKPKQTTRMLKLTCNNCEFTCRTTSKHILAHVEEGLECPVRGCDGGLTLPEGVDLPEAA